MLSPCWVVAVVGPVVVVRVEGLYLLKSETAPITISSSDLQLVPYVLTVDGVKL